MTGHYLWERVSEARGHDWLARILGWHYSDGQEEEDCNDEASCYNSIRGLF